MSTDFLENHGLLVNQFLDFNSEQFSHIIAIFDEFFFLQNSQNCAGSCSCNRVASVGVEEHLGVEHFPNVFTHHDSADDTDSVAQTFAQSHDIWDAVVILRLEAPHGLAGSAQSGLHFVSNAQTSVLSGDFEGPLQLPVLHGEYTAISH